jgi:alpha/beta superfamily hydrolase
MKKYSIAIFICCFVILFDFGLWLAVQYLSPSSESVGFSSIAPYPAASSMQQMSSSFISQPVPNLRIE